MGWREAHSTVVTIFKETIDLTQQRGLPPRFKHVPEMNLNDEAGIIVDTRSFSIGIVRMAMKANITIGLPRWFRYSCTAAIAYRKMMDQTKLLEVIALDHASLSKRMPDPGNWEQSTSTIESIGLGGEIAAEAEVQEEEGALLVFFPFTMEFRE